MRYTGRRRWSALSLSQPAASLQILGKVRVPARAPCAMPGSTPTVTCSTASNGVGSAFRAGEDAGRRMLIGLGVQEAAHRETLPRAHSLESLKITRPALQCVVIAFTLAHLCFSDLVQAVRPSPYLSLTRHAS